MSDISNSSLGEKLDPAFEEAIKNASFEEMKVLLANRTVSSGLAVRDIYDGNILIPTLQTAAPHRFAETIEVEGRKLIFEGDSELALEKSIGDYFRSLHPAATSETRTEVQRDSAGRFTAITSPEEQVAENERKAALSLQFQIGQISASDYIEQSGAVADYLEKVGVPLEDLRASIAASQRERFTQSWEQATEAFLNGPAGSDWPGGTKNLEIAGELIKSNNLVDSPSVGTLAAVYQHMKDNGMLVENVEVTAHQKISNATSFEEIRQAGSSLFGRN